MSDLRLIVIFIALSFTTYTYAGGFGWYYQSFDWNALQSYFGNGSQSEKKVFKSHMESLIRLEEKDPYFFIKFTERKKQLWENFINDGIDYSLLNKAEQQYADQVINIIMSPEGELRFLNIKSETMPDYFHPDAIRTLLKYASPKGKRLLLLFMHGRSFGETEGRRSCLDDSESWYCYETYIILSPTESEQLSKEILRIIHLEEFADNEYEIKTYVGSFAEILAKVSKQGRGIMAFTTD